MSVGRSACRPMTAGQSDKYGQVYVERVGNTGFDDPAEPVALLRAQDDLAYEAMLVYLRLNDEDAEVSAAQAESVRRQVEAFERFRHAHPDRVRKPGRR
jgi:hypothetical protein